MKKKIRRILLFGLGNQLTGDEIFLKSNIKTQELDSLLISGNVFMIQKILLVQMDTIKSRVRN